MSHLEHEQLASEAQANIRCGVITISDTRTEANDTSGALIRELLAAHGHTVLRSQVIKDEPAQIVGLIAELAASGCQTIITSGGTGIAARDTTFEAVDGLLQKRLPGFGEIFRMLSYQEIGPAAMLSRATAGTIGDTLIFCLPGSSNAVRLGMEKLIVPELSHLVWEIFRHKGR
ncbi:MAG: MogA/MoaB family molybdenum cofactor biosynthesis protein [Roseiflexaceae bacterium]|nr:MogA/MoaB family molybdenum cofactor biosynthesis protein [Roseiflexaceae bacterium]